MNPNSQRTNRADTFLCLDEGFAAEGDNSTRCLTQCEECRQREELERAGKPEEDR